MTAWTCCRCRWARARRSRHAACHGERDHRRLHCRQRWPRGGYGDECGALGLDGTIDRSFPTMMTLSNNEKLVI
ncbi:hypothetical protein U9M48_024871 [Paspalum notatum var. saurae]|uniref:Uncharacterized protein n=1 Tax=Paspalum notatum var. saurae TaxID=547442 RepID=A0AAQ3WWF7_PASNO